MGGSLGKLLFIRRLHWPSEAVNPIYLFLRIKNIYTVQRYRFDVESHFSLSRSPCFSDGFAVSPRKAQNSKGEGKKKTRHEAGLQERKEKIRSPRKEVTRPILR